MKQTKSWATDKWRPPSETTRRDLIGGTIDSLIHAFWIQNDIEFKKLHEIGQIVSYRQMKTIIRHSSTRDLIDGTIDSLIQAFFRQRL